MKDRFWENFIAGLIAAVINVIWQTALGAWMLMLAMQNAYHADHRIPHFSYWQSVWVALPLMAFITFCFNSSKDGD